MFRLRHPVAVPEKIFGLTHFLDFFDRSHSLRSLHLPPAALPSLPVAAFDSSNLLVVPIKSTALETGLEEIRLHFYFVKIKVPLRRAAAGGAHPRRI